MYVKMKNKKYHTAWPILKYHTAWPILKYHTAWPILKYHTAWPIPISNIKIVERGKAYTLTHKYTQIYGLGTGTSINRGGVKLVLRTRTSPLSETASLHVQYFITSI